MNRDGILRLVNPVSKKIANLSIDDRLILLTSLTCQEICNLPAGDRQEKLKEVMSVLPDIFHTTETTMRQALTDNARDGL